MNVREGKWKMWIGNDDDDDWEQAGGASGGGGDLLEANYREIQRRECNRNAEAGTTINTGKAILVNTSSIDHHQFP